MIMIHDGWIVDLDGSTMIICEMFGLYEAAGATAGCAGFSVASV
jgi:hypothetical protein